MDLAVRVVDPDGHRLRIPSQLAAAILIDATLVRGVLLPATMKLLGERNWYLSRWLEWLPRCEFGEPSVAPEAPPAAASA